ncbi:DUF6708 domain-containing protein [uncultured Cedecea sp.]|uniref:DUF6708 domain-containing protein n=1 Tax=uncultured Cedecea sp. TaxID=988762 RepID=UPI002621B8E3|nr:DUF6708 domain-containing protein [uncultured Cedecea sp.]
MTDNEKSRLIKPVRYWSEDLPDPEEEQMVFPRLIRVNEINDVWMEIPRYVNHGWGVLWFGGILVLSCFIYFILSPYVVMDMLSDSSSFIFYFTIFFPLMSMMVWCFRTVLFAARGAPVRFNRKQQKVYVYEQQCSVWPWWRWPVEIKVFDWADIQGERVQRVGHADWGHRIYCAVCEPGTYLVKDRFILTWTEGNIYEVYGLWSACCQYMQGKAVSDKPLRTHIPPSWTPFKTVKWPKEMDEASKAVPEWA